VNPDSSKLLVIDEYTSHQAYQILNNQFSSIPALNFCKRDP
jgi:hypothetical protein